MTNTNCKFCVLQSPSFAHAPASNNGGWGGDQSNSPNATNPWFKRGGAAENGTNAGVFAFNRWTGATNQTIGWRAVVPPGFSCVPECLSNQALGKRYAKYAENVDKYQINPVKSGVAKLIRLATK